MPCGVAVTLDSLLMFAVSQVIALKIRRPDSGRPYLFPQLFVGLSYLFAALIALELRRVRRRRLRAEE